MNNPVAFHLEEGHSSLPSLRDVLRIGFRHQRLVLGSFLGILLAGGLAVLLTIATAFDPVPIGGVGPAASADGVVAGFRYALVAAALLGVLGLIIALRIKQPKAPKGPG